MIHVVERNLDARAAGQRAVAVAPLVTEFATKVSADIVSRLTSQYNSGRLTPEAALAGVAEIAAIDKLLELIVKTAHRGQRADMQESERAVRESEAE